jgi:S-adenosylmethionine:tRNA ribosyltransferase-isomerase
LSFPDATRYAVAVRTADFHFQLPPELIAQQPAPRRDQSRLLVLHRHDHDIEHRRFQDFPEYLRAGDVLVLNNSRVIPARLHGTNAKTGGRFELLLLEENAVNDWWAMLRPGKRAKIGTPIQLQDKNGARTKIVATVTAVNAEGHRRLQFSGTENLFAELENLGELPLPPYIERHGELPADRERYQTVFAQPAGSVAAPTAGLHFTPELLESIRARGVKICFVTLHVGAGTFLPVKTETVAEHKMHAERFELGEETVAAVNEAKKNGRRVIAVGTTAVRTLETAARLDAGKLNVHAGKTDIFIFPPAEFKIVDALLTNFHLPESTLLMLVSAFAAPGEKTRGRELVLAAYAAAIRERYRFFSYGDAMLIT